MLEISGLRVATSAGDIVRGANLEVGRGEVVGLFGESGCGKTTLGMAVVGLLGDGRRVSAGSIRFEGEEVAAPGRDLTADLRGARIGFVPQDPFASFDPLRRVGPQVARPLLRHLGLGGDEARGRVLDLFASLGVADPVRTARRFPHELSGGMLQRAAIAAAIACRPSLVIADEPTTALDALVEAQVAEALTAAVRDLGASLLLITHNLGLLSRTTDRLGAMYAGTVVEFGPAARVLESPRHPYVAALVAASVSMIGETERLPTIEGQPPALPGAFEGCAFSPRCHRADDRCRTEVPAHAAAGEEGAACFHPLGGP